MKQTYLYIALAVALAIIAGLVLFILNGTQPNAVSVSQPTSTSTPTASTSASVRHTASYGTKTVTYTAPPPVTTNPINPSNPTVNVNYTNSGFSPKVLTIRRDTTVNFVNTTNASMWVASDPYPTNSGYSGTTADQHCPDTSGTHFDECSSVGKGNTYSFTFLKVGTWTYHDQQHPANTGTIIVTN